MPGKLVVVAPAIRSITRHWNALIHDRLKEEPELKDAEWFVWNHKAGLFSTQTADVMARELHARIDAKFNLSNYDEIILVGHSLGGMLVRAAYLMGVDDTYGDARVSPWAQKVSRIVLFASVNRGVEPKNVPFRFIALPLVNFLNSFKKLLVTDLWVGSAFITNLRIGWIRFFGNGQAATYPQIIQLLGVKDGIVKRNDSVDVYQFQNAQQIDIAGANHRDLYRLDVLKDPDLINERYRIIRNAIAGGLGSRESTQAVEQKKIIFILPGIRDASPDWAEDLGRAIKAIDASVEIQKSNYGYFSAAKFLLPWKRKRNIRSFQNQYSEALARFPNAVFSCIGHSNGTYILGRSLVKLPRMQFKRIYLAGSVLPEDFNWTTCFTNSQVAEVRNDRASADWPVACLCKSLNSLGMKDIGVGGFDGFQQPITHETFFYDGGHGQAIQPGNHPVIANYILGNSSPTPELLLRRDVPIGFRRLSNLSPWLTRLFLLVILGTVIYAAWLFNTDPKASLIIVGILATVLIFLYVGLDIV